MAGREWRARATRGSAAKVRLTLRLVVHALDRDARQRHAERAHGVRRRHGARRSHDAGAKRDARAIVANSPVVALTNHGRLEEAFPLGSPSRELRG